MEIIITGVNREEFVTSYGNLFKGALTSKTSQVLQVYKVRVSRCWTQRAGGRLGRAEASGHTVLVGGVRRELSPTATTNITK